MNPRPGVTTAAAGGTATPSPSAGPWRLVLLCGVQLLMLLDFSIVNVALPRIETSLGFSHNGVQWVVSAYALTYGGLLLLGGRLSDQLGRRRMLVPGLALFGLASLIGGLATSPGLLVAMRALQGVGAAFIGPAVLSLITTGTAPGPERNKALGWFSAASASGFAIGVLAGGVLTQLTGWRWVFFVNVPLTALAILAAYRLIPADGSRSGENRYDVPGAILSTLGVSGVIYGLTTLGGDRATGLAAIAAGLVMLICFVVVESRSSNPLVPLSIFRTRSVSVANLAALLVPGVMGAVALALSLFLQQVQQRDALETGLVFLTLGVAVVFAGPIAAMLVTKIGPKAVCAGGSVIVAAGVFVLSRITPDSSYAAVLLPGLVLTGIGFSSFFAASTITATMDVPAEQQGLAGGLLNASVQFGTALCVALLMAVAEGGADADDVVSAATRAENYGNAFAIGAAVALATAVLVLVALPGRSRAGAKQQES
ncbi:MFS transporter [Streptomyces xanthophaeus]|nr:MFS transporter [Streptomyces xanthophaeus]WCD86531.1 Antiseptic resistance protein [Streptomyces xanthophaeus]